MGFAKEFREFALKGNIVDLAVAVVVGAAFGAIITSLTDDIITPAILAPALKAAHLENIQDLKWGAVKYGSFLSSIIKFLIIALSLFMVIKGINRMKRRKEAAVVEAPKPPEYTLQEKLLMEIRDNLKK
ncbi:large conductance mechanosensitive channel protein MscL [Flaviaesturariibacter flavus]|uniref:Large-conductance mechanosensitive channel n=1 Tax=Flaviaesturariibacter flavus TaxID=2502780 RepID=A0A4R1B8L1_9BACT|nr:large conductance mechanosensitive channel protein MscL [Flaviaesturariibacter flavus]TCJ12523.1 large conductance mechanosensitive channel protein MscL [Flaviaesturariibacter flavus]